MPRVAKSTKKETSTKRKELAPVEAVPTRPVGPLVMIVKLYPSKTRVRDKATGLWVTQIQHPLPSSNTYYRMKHGAKRYNKAGNRFHNPAIDLDNAIKEATYIAVRRAMEVAALEDTPALVAAYCIVKIYYPDKRRRDHHNTVFKSAFDAMKNAGVWKDDNRVELYMPLPIISRHNPRIEFHIYQLPEGETGESPIEPVPEGWEWDEELVDLNDTYIT